LTEKPVTQKDLVLLKCQTMKKRKLQSLLLTKLNWMAKRLWSKKPMTVKNAHAEAAVAAVVDTKAEEAVAVATRVEAVEVAVVVDTNVAMITVAAVVVSNVVMTVAAAAVDAEKAEAAVEETVGKLK
jgi:hypothetical protein